MSPFLLVSLVLAGLDLGGRIGGVFPSAGLGGQHNSSTRLGASAGYAFGRNRVELGYDFAELSGRQAAPYRMTLHTLSSEYGFEFLHRPAWGLEATAGAGYSIVRRTLNAARESGRSAAANLGFGLVQRQGPARFNLGLVYSLYIESRPAGGTTRLAFTPLFGIRTGVAYVF